MNIRVFTFKTFEDLNVNIISFCYILLINFHEHLSSLSSCRVQLCSGEVENVDGFSWKRPWLR